MNRILAHPSFPGPSGGSSAWRLLAEEHQMSLPDLITDVLDQHLDDVRHLEAQADAGETFAHTLQQEQAEAFSPLLAWLRMSPEARWDAV